MRGKARGAAVILVIALLASCGGGARPVPRRPTHRSTSQPRIALSILSHAVYLVDPNTGGASTLATGLSNFQAGFAAWAPDRRSIAYGDEGILIEDPGSGAGRVLVRGPSISMPAWSPDGRWIAYGDGRDLWVTPVRTLQATYLHLPLTLAPLDMAWAPSTRIAFNGLALTCHVPFGCSSTSRSDLWVVESDGSDLRRLTNFGDVESPRWSPDGSKLLFVRRQRHELWTVDADGSHAIRLGHAAGVLAADWSPDGSRIATACLGRTSKTVWLWSMRSDGSGLRRVGGPFPGTAASLDW